MSLFVSTVAGQFNQFNMPTGMTCDSSGNLYVLDSGNNCIRKVREIRPSGFFGLSLFMDLTVPGGIPISDSGNTLIDITIDSSGNFYVTSRFMIRKITPSKIVTIIAEYPEVIDPVITLDSSGNMYIAGSDNRIRKMTPGGVFTTIAGNGIFGYADGTGTATQFGTPQGIAIDSSGNLYVADTGNQRIRKITSGGVVTTFASGFMSPNFIRIDSSRNLYVADDRRVCKITSGGVVTVLAGGDYSTSGYVGGTPVTLADFSRLSGIARDSSGNLYVADVISNLISKISSSSPPPPSPVMDAVTTFTGVPITAGDTDGDYTTAKFQSPVKIAIDSSGNLYVTETAYQRIRKVTSDGYVTTIAGNGTAGWVEGTGIAAQFKNPYGITIDSSGNLYVADNGNHCIRKIIPTGFVSTFAGNGTPGYYDGTGTLALFNYPYGITIDSSGNLYVAEYSGRRIRKITPSGIVSTLAGTGVNGYIDGPGELARFGLLMDITIDSSGNLYVIDSSNKVRVITPDGEVGTIGVYSSAALRSITIDSYGNLYVVDISNQCVRKISPPSATITTIAGNGTAGYADGTGIAAQFNNPQGITIDSSGNLYVADTSNKCIRKIGLPIYILNNRDIYTVSTFAQQIDYAGDISISPFNLSQSLYVATNSNIRKITQAGVVSTLANPPSVSFSSITTPTDLYFAVNAAGNRIYMSYPYLSFIYKFVPGISLDTFAGSSYGYANGTGAAAQFKSPSGMVLDSSENVYVADELNHSIRKVTSGGIVTTIAGNGTPGYADGTGTAALFNYPKGIAIHASTGNLYVADTSNQRIRKITPGGVVTTIAGNGSFGYVDGDKTNARFSNPYKIAVDSFENVYVVDYLNNVIRKVTPSGFVTTLSGNGTAGWVDGQDTVAQFDYPWGIAVDSSDNLYVTETNHNSVRKITKTISTVPSSPVPTNLRCQVGTYKPSGSWCILCPAGSYSDTINSASCTPCAAGKYSSEGSSSCTPCPAGYFYNATGGFSSRVCIPCPAGTTSSAGSTSCTPCAAGSYSSSEGSSSCTPCAAGSYSSSTGATSSCTPCWYGTYSATAGATACTPCAAGTYGPALGLTACTPCEIGTYSATTGQQNSCSPCAPGSYSDATGATSCKLCPAGQYQPSPQQSSCLSCTDGISSQGATACTPCSSGTVPSSNKTSCVQCSPGTFTQTTYCEPCGYGTYSDTYGAASCTQCPAGTYNDYTGSTNVNSCIECQGGYYSSAGSRFCTPCPGGTYFAGTRGTSISVCTPCPAGTYGQPSSTVGYTSCTPCPVNTYSTAVGGIVDGRINTVSSFCLPCLNGSRSSAGSSSCTTCSAGSKFVPNPDHCELCPIGTYSSINNSLSCTSCPVNKTTAATGSTNIYNCKCMPGTSKVPGAASCELCPAGTYSDKLDTSTCTPCPVDTYNTGTGGASLSVCTPCPQYYHSPSGSTLASQCAFSQQESECGSNQYYDHQRGVCYDKNLPLSWNTDFTQIPADCGSNQYYDSEDRLCYFKDLSLSCLGKTQSECIDLTYNGVNAAKVSLTDYVYGVDPTTNIDRNVLPSALQSKLQQCEGMDNCNLVAADFQRQDYQRLDQVPYAIDTLQTTAEDKALAIRSGAQQVPVIFSAYPGFITNMLSIVGTRIAGYTNTTSESCSITCKGNSSCKGFNFNMGTNACDLYSTIDSKEYSDTLISYIRENIPTIPVSQHLPPLLTNLGNQGSLCRDVNACNSNIQTIIDDTPVVTSFTTADLDACAYCPLRSYDRATRVVTNELGDSKVGGSADMIFQTGTPTVHNQITDGYYMIVPYINPVLGVDWYDIAYFKGDNNNLFKVISTATSTSYDSFDNPSGWLPSTIPIIAKNKNFKYELNTHPTIMFSISAYSGVADPNHPYTSSYRYTVESDTFKIIPCDYVNNGFLIRNSDFKYIRTVNGVLQDPINLPAKYSPEYNQCIFIITPSSWDAFYNDHFPTYPATSEYYSFGNLILFYNDVLTYYAPVDATRFTTTVTGRRWKFTGQMNANKNVGYMESYQIPINFSDVVTIDPVFVDLLARPYNWVTLPSPSLGLGLP